MIDLKVERHRAGMTQQQLADAIGVIRQTISNIEIGVAKPSIPTARALGEVLKLDWKKFFED